MEQNHRKDQETKQKSFDSRLNHSCGRWSTDLTCCAHASGECRRYLPPSLSGKKKKELVAPAGLLTISCAVSSWRLSWYKVAFNEEICWNKLSRLFTRVLIHREDFCLVSVCHLSSGCVTNPKTAPTESAQGGSRDQTLILIFNLWIFKKINK